MGQVGVVAMNKKRTIIEKSGNEQPDRLIVEESTDSKDQPAVLAYRLGSLEQTVKEGFQTQTDRFDELIKGFVTEKEMAEAKAEADEEHKRIWKEINAIKANAKWWFATTIAGAGVVVGIVGLILKIVKK